MGLLDGLKGMWLPGTPKTGKKREQPNGCIYIIIIIIFILLL